MNGSFGFHKRSLFPWRLRFSYHVEEFDNTARYNNHQDEASSGKWLSIHDGSVSAAKLKQASKVDPSKEIKYFWMKIVLFTYSVTLAPPHTRLRCTLRL